LIYLERERKGEVARWGGILLSKERELLFGENRFGEDYKNHKEKTP
jgi:hypothetical protein